MKEIGGYFECEQYTGNMLHENAIALNCGRNCLAYLIASKNITKILLPYFLCDSIKDICTKFNVKTRYYHVDEHFETLINDVEENEWIYLVNYYGQISINKVLMLKKIYGNIILDNTQAYFTTPIEGVDTLYSCRKYFGVSDGAFLYTDKIMNQKYEIDISYKRMEYVLGRYETNASSLYKESVENNELFNHEEIKYMSRLTNNILHSINYKKAKEIREKNFKYLDEQLGYYNKLHLVRPEGPFMYPFFVKNGEILRKKLIEKNIYIPVLWPDVFKNVKEDSFEWNLAKNIVPLPVDQRYSEKDMDFIIDILYKSKDLF